MARRVRRKTLSDEDVEGLKPKSKRYAFPDPELPRHYIRVTPRGDKTFVVVARDPNGKQVWHTVGKAPLKIEKARKKAREIIAAIQAGEDRAGPQSFKVVAEAWFKRHVEAKDLRSKEEIRRYLALPNNENKDPDGHLKPWHGRYFTSIRRSDVAKILDEIEDNAGPVAADKALAFISMICNWYAARHDEYSSPIVKGMRRSDPSERARDRILSDEEIRSVWKAAEASGRHGAIIRLLLLTAQRRDKVASMRWDDFDEDDNVWAVPAEARQKGTGRNLVLPEAAAEIIKAQSAFVDNPYVFASPRGKTHFKGFSKAKRDFDERCPIEHWELHDLRRTARSLMSRAGVSSDVAERVLGHAIKGVEGVYDRHEYRDEKADALEKLAGLVELILNPPVGNVVPLEQHA